MLNQERLSKMNKNEIEGLKEEIEDSVDSAVEALAHVMTLINRYGSGSCKSYLGANISCLIKEGIYISRDQTLLDFRNSFEEMDEEFENYLHQ